MIKTFLISAILIFSASAMAQDKKVEASFNVLGRCKFSSVGWVKTFGKNKLQFDRLVEVEFLSIKVLPNKIMTKNDSNTAKKLLVADGV